MDIFFKPTFIKDYKKLPAGIRAEVYALCAELFSEIKSVSDVEGVHIKAMQGFGGYYRVRHGDYRIGFKKEKEKIIFMRVLYRKDIYKFFP